ncbi:hypothetical protein JTB14_030651 [Gonioctena quinquepunctata]|nr:hypothetical protein JTB14_030651 [Gonioctena quinquepunctata]
MECLLNISSNPSSKRLPLRHKHDLPLLLGVKYVRISRVPSGDSAPIEIQPIGHNFFALLLYGDVLEGISAQTGLVEGTLFFLKHRPDGVVCGAGGYEVAHNHLVLLAYSVGSRFGLAYYLEKNKSVGIISNE